jgi:hypothetical protein
MVSTTDFGKHHLTNHSVVPISYKISIASICTLRNFKVREERPYDITVAEALMATLANPPFFTPISIFQDATTFEHIGGDLTLSNPAREVLAEAHKAFGSGKRDAWLLSIGCGHPEVMAVPRIHDTLSWYSLLETIAKNAEGVAQQIDTEMVDQNHYHRFSVLKGLGDPKETIKIKRGDIITHTRIYLGNARVSREMSRCVDYLKQPGNLEPPICVPSPHANVTRAVPVPDPVAIQLSIMRQWLPPLVLFLSVCFLMWFFRSAYQKTCGKFLGVEHQLCFAGAYGPSPRVDLNIGSLQPRDGITPLEQLGKY